MADARIEWLDMGELSRTVWAAFVGADPRALVYRREDGAWMAFVTCNFHREYPSFEAAKQVVEETLRRENP